VRASSVNTLIGKGSVRYIAEDFFELGEGGAQVFGDVGG
jgi:hypothetical protein